MESKRTVGISIGGGESEEEEEQKKKTHEVMIMPNQFGDDDEEESVVPKDMGTDYDPPTIFGPPKVVPDQQTGQQESSVA